MQDLFTDDVFGGMVLSMDMKKFLLLLSVLFGLLVLQSQASNLPACKGSYNLNTLTNCFGINTYVNGDKYVGEFKNGKLIFFQS